MEWRLRIYLILKISLDIHVTRPVRLPFLWESSGVRDFLETLFIYSRQTFSFGLRSWSRPLVTTITTPITAVTRTNLHQRRPSTLPGSRSLSRYDLHIVPLPPQSPSTSHISSNLTSLFHPKVHDLPKILLSFDGTILLIDISKSYSTVEGREKVRVTFVEGKDGRSVRRVSHLQTCPSELMFWLVNQFLVGFTLLVLTSSIDSSIVFLNRIFILIILFVLI